MAFYYEAEAPVWKYKERYGEWKKFPKKTGQKLERTFKKIKAGDAAVVEIEWKNPEGQIHKINLQTMTSQNTSSYYRNSEVSREGYPYPAPGNKNALAKIHKKYLIDVVEHGEEVKRFDLVPFFQDTRIDPDGIDSLIVLAMCEADSFLDVTEKQFVTGLSKCGCSSLADIRNKLAPIKTALIEPGRRKLKVLKSFSKWLFVAVKEESARTIQTAQLAGLLGIMCPESKFPLSTQFGDFLQNESVKKDGDRKTCSKDDWVMVVEFIAAKNSFDNFDNYVEDEGWPLVISDCYEWVQEGCPRVPEDEIEAEGEN